MLAAAATLRRPGLTRQMTKKEGLLYDKGFI